MTPGWEASYVAKISAVLHGSLTPHQIRWELPMADGLRFVTYWWNHFYERIHSGGVVYHGVDCRSVQGEEEKEGGEIV